MKAQKKILISGFIIALLAPLVLNLIIVIPSPCPSLVAGNSGDWIGFWGGYLGGILAAIVSFIVLFYTLRQNQLAHMIQLRENALRELKKEVLTRIERIDYVQLFSLALKTARGVSPEDIDSEILKLNSLHSEASALADSWGAVHEKDTDLHAKLFNDKYLECLRAYKAVIDRLTKFYCHQHEQKNYYGKFDVNKLNQILQTDRGSLASYYQALYEAASHWLDNEQKQIVGLKEKLSHLV